MASSITPASPKGHSIEEELKLNLDRSVSSGVVTMSPELFEKVRSADIQSNIVFD